MMRGITARASILLGSTITAICFLATSCNQRSQDASTESSEPLSEKMRSEYREQLKRNPEKDFDSEWIRTTNLEKALVDQHGFDAIVLIFEDRNSANYVKLGELPSDCPWGHLNGMSVTAAIEVIFGSLREALPMLIDALKERCRYIYAEKTEEEWRLHYFLDITLYDGRPYYHIYTGGSPNPAPRPNRNLAAYQWEVPKDLRCLYAVHDGLGPVLGSSSITVMAEMMDPICEKQGTYPEGYRFRDLLEFYPDGAGNAQCVYREGGALSTVDWDHETWELSGRESLFDHVDERMSKLDEE